MLCTWFGDGNYRPTQADRLLIDVEMHYYNSPNLISALQNQHSSMPNGELKRPKVILPSIAVDDNDVIVIVDTKIW